MTASPRVVAVLCALALVPLGWFPFVRGTRVPLLGFFDFGMHELGHLLTMVVGLPHTVVLLAGNGTQALVPLVIGAVLLWRREVAPAAVCLAWSGSCLQDASVYIADATRLQLTIIGNGHDWQQLLGPDHFDVLEHTDAIADAVRTAGLVLWVVAALVVGWRLLSVFGLLEDRPVRRPARSAASDGPAPRGGPLL